MTTKYDLSVPLIGWTNGAHRTDVAIVKVVSKIFLDLLTVSQKSAHLTLHLVHDQRFPSTPISLKFLLYNFINIRFLVEYPRKLFVLDHLGLLDKKLSEFIAQPLENTLLLQNHAEIHIRCPSWSFYIFSTPLIFCGFVRYLLIEISKYFLHHVFFLRFLNMRLLYCLFGLREHGQFYRLA